jgi:hydroxypyruvate isomerase
MQSECDQKFMPRFAANLSMMFTEWSFLDRFAAAADAGFEAVEYLFPYDFAPEDLAHRLQDHRLEQALFNLPPGDWSAGECGIAALAGRETEFAASVDKALIYAEATGVKRLHVMSGLADATDPTARNTYEKNLRIASEKLAAKTITLLIEPINSRDMPGYFLNDFDLAGEILESLGLADMMLQFDVYHRQIIHGDVIMGLRAMAAMIGHIQIAGVPDRHEPDSGEVNYPAVFNELDRLGYSGWVGCEYRPSAGTESGLGWFQNWK